MVNGAKYSLILDFCNGGIYRLNKSATRIIESGGKGLRISEVAEELNLELSDISAFVTSLSRQGLIQLSSLPPKPETQKTDEKEASPQLDFLWVEMTSRCNLRCLHCYADAKPKQDPDLTTDEIKRVIGQAADLGCKKIQFTGGECTLREDLRDLIDHARLKGFSFIEVFTNGTLLTEPLIRYFASVGVNVAISIYSYRQETHGTITGTKGSFEKTLNSLKLLLAYGVPTRCATIAMKQNEVDLDGTSYYLQQLGVQNRPPDPIRPSGRGCNMENWPQQYVLKTVKTEPNFVANREIYDYNRSRNSCWFGKIAITNEGDILPCVFARDQVAGNIKDQSLKEIIENRMLKFWNLTIDQIDVCKDCEYRYLCHDCRPWAYGFTGNLYAKSPRCTYNPYTGEWGSAESAFLDIQQKSADLSIIWAGLINV